MTATNIFYNFVGFRYSPPLKVECYVHLTQSTNDIWTGEAIAMTHISVTNTIIIIII